MKKYCVFLLFLGSVAHGQNVAIIDRGYHEEDYDRFKSYLRLEVCFSEYADEVLIGPGPFQDTDSWYYRNISVCKNKEREQLNGIKTSSLPRQVTVATYKDIPQYFDTVPHYLSLISHNSYVLEAARRVGASFNQLINVQTASFKNNKPGEYTYPNNFELRGTSAERMVDVLDHINLIARVQSISAVSLSFSYGYYSPGSVQCNAEGLGNSIRALIANNVAVVAASGDGPKANTGLGYLTKMAAPACLNEVISVGALNDKSQLMQYSNTSVGLDFLARGDVPPIKTPHVTQNGTSFAAPRVATYLGRLKQRNRSKSMAEIVAALKQVGMPLPDGRNGVTAIRVFDSDYVKADQLLKGANIEPIPPGDPQYPIVPIIDVISYNFGESNTGRYGVGFGNGSYNAGYGFNIFMSEVANTTISNGLASQRSVKKLTENQVIAQSSSTCGSMYELTYQVYDIDYLNEVALYINKSYIKRIEPTGNNTLKSRKVEFCGSRLKIGNNLIEFRKANNNGAWGVTNIALKFVDRGSINLTLGAKDTDSYGYGFGSNRHRSQLVINFTKPNNDNDLVFSVTGWDIDRIDETKVFLNDRILGYLDNNCSSCFNGGDDFKISSDKLHTGTNQLTFIQRSADGNWSGFQDEKWGVTDLLIKEKGLIFVRYKKYLIPIDN